MEELNKSSMNNVHSREKRTIERNLITPSLKREQGKDVTSQMRKWR